MRAPVMDRFCSKATSIQGNLGSLSQPRWCNVIGTNPHATALTLALACNQHVSLEMGIQTRTKKR